jgi:hypothetical protein
MNLYGDTMATTNEMNLPIISAQAMAVTGDVMASAAPYSGDMDMSIAIGAPNTVYDPANVTVYANNITPVTYNSQEEVAAFDIVFSVGINCGETTKTFQVVKRIGIDKCRIACEAEASSPVSIVESKSDALKEDAVATRRRFRRLAGLD